MTSIVATGSAGLMAPSRPGSHGGKGGDAEGSRFDDALAADTARQRSAEPREPDARPVWKLGGLADARLKEAAAETAPSGEDAPALEVEDLPIDGLAALVAPVVGTPEKAVSTTPAVGGAQVEIDTAGASAVSADTESSKAAVLAAATQQAAIVQAEAQPAAGAVKRAAGEVQVLSMTQIAAKGGEAAPFAALATKPAEKIDPARERETSDPAVKSAPSGIVAADAAKPAAPAVIEGVAPPAAAGGTGDRSPIGEPRPRPGPSMPVADKPLETIQGRVSVLGSQNALAPAPAPVQALSPTAAGLVAAIEGDPAWRAAAMSDQAAANGSRGASTNGVSTLRIQLHPAELGMVTARLTATGEQLSIEIQVESNDARQRLTSDSDAIVKALRSVGYDIDGMTIQQSTPGSAGAGQQQGAPGRDGSSPNPQYQGEGAGRGQGERGASGRNGEGAPRHGIAERPAERAGGGLYI